MAIKALGFDFDDTLMNLHRSKYKLIQEVVFKKFGIKRGVKKVYKQAASSPSSFEKMRDLLRVILSRKPTKKEVLETRAEFNKRYKQALSTCPLMIEFATLNLLKKSKILFIISLEDEKTVKEVCRHCKIDLVFDAVFGGPKEKTENFELAMKKFKLKPSEILFFGDTNNDIQSARKMSISAIGIRRSKAYRKEMEKFGAFATFPSFAAVNFKKLLSGKMSK